MESSRLYQNIFSHELSYRITIFVIVSHILENLRLRTKGACIHMYLRLTCLTCKDTYILCTFRWNWNGYVNCIKWNKFYHFLCIYLVVLVLRLVRCTILFKSDPTPGVKFLFQTIGTIQIRMMHLLTHLVHKFKNNYLVLVWLQNELFRIFWA